MLRHVMASRLLFAAALVGCMPGGDAAHDDPAELPLTVTPAVASVFTGGLVVFSAGVESAAHTAVTWSVVESVGGAISSRGVYTAPGEPGTYHVRATSVANTARSATAVVTVVAPAAASIVVSPKTATVSTGESLTFTATVSGSSDHGVAWSVHQGGAGGSISPFGVYTAPQVAGTYTIVATSRANASKRDTATVQVTATGGSYITPGPCGGEVTVVIDSHATRAISPLIYGVNSKYATDGFWPARGLPGHTPLDRYGGNSWTAWNWEKGYTNFGNDWPGGFNGWNTAQWVVDGGAVAGSSVKWRIDSAFADGASIILTVPIMGYVARDGIETGVAPSIAPDRWTPVAPSSARFMPMRAKNPAGAGAGVPHADAIYADDMAAWLSGEYGVGRGDHFSDPTRRIFLALDNEPEFWGGDNYSAHSNLQGVTSGGTTAVTPHQVHVDKTIATAAALKDVLPDVTIFGGVFGGIEGLYALDNGDIAGDHPPHGIPQKYRSADFPYLEMWADALHQASTARGARLVDVLDFHDYPDTDRSHQIVNNDHAAQTTELVDIRCQEPRHLWDPGYVTPRANGRFGSSLELIPRIRATLAKYPNGPQLLATTEYFYGRGGDISNAIAHADTFGIYAREGFFAATIWPWSNVGDVYGGDYATAYAGTIAALRAFIAHDGGTSRFGDTYVQTTVTDGLRPADPRCQASSNPSCPGQTMERITAYASIDASNPARMVIVAINKTQAAALNVGFQVIHTVAFARAQVFDVTGANGASHAVSGPTRRSDLSLSSVNAFEANLPAQSITVFVLVQ